MPPETRSSGQGNKSLSAHCCRDRFRAHLTKVKASDSCTSSNAVKRQKKNGNTSLEPCSPKVIKDVDKETVSERSKLQGFSKDLAAGTEGFNVSNRKRKLVHERFELGCRKNKLKCIDKTKKSTIKVLDRQTSEVNELQALWYESKAKLEKCFKLECLEVNRSINSTETVRTDKLKILEANHRKKLEELESEMGSLLKRMKAKHNNERKALFKEVNRRMNERKSPEDNGLLDNLPTKAAELIPAKSFTSSGNDLEEEDSKEHGSVVAHVPLFHGPKESHSDAAENSSSVEPAENISDKKMDINSDDGELSKSLEENGLLDNLPTKAAEVIPPKKFTSSANDLEEEASKEHGSVGAHVPLLHDPEEPHNDAAENSRSAEAAENFADWKMDITSYGGDISKSKSAIQINYEARLFQNVGERAFDSLDVQGIQSPLEVAAEQVEKIATIKNDPLSAENPTLQQVADANEESTAVRMEQHDEAIQAQLPEILESMNSPSTMNPSVVEPVSQVLLLKSEFMNSPSTMNPSVPVPVSQVLLLNSKSVNSPSTVKAVNPSVAVPISQAILNPLNNEDVCAETSRDVLPSSDHSDGMPCNTSEQAACIHLPPDSASPVDAAVSHPVELTQTCSTSCGAPNILLMEPRIRCETLEAPTQEDHMPLNRSVEVSPRPVLDAYPPSHNSNQFQSHMPWWSFPSSILAFQEFDQLQKENERLWGEWNQVTRNHEDMVLLLNSERDKEIEKLHHRLKTKHELMVQKEEASYLQKISEIRQNHLKSVIDIILAEARIAPQRARQLSIADQNAATRSAAAPPMSLPPLLKIDGNGSMELDRVCVEKVDGDTPQVTNTRPRRDRRRPKRYED